MFQKINPMQEDKCQICQDCITNDLYQVSCCRCKYHRKCILQWLATNDKCPNCRSTIEKELLKNEQVKLLSREISKMKIGTPMWVEHKMKINELNDTITIMRVHRIMREHNLNRESDEIEKIIKLERQHVRDLIEKATNDENERRQTNDKWYNKLFRYFK